jgi:hypothetical protein
VFVWALLHTAAAEAKHRAVQEVSVNKINRIVVVVVGLLILMSFIGAIAVSAQEPVPIKSNEVFALLADYPPEADPESEATGFRLYINNMLITTAGREVLSNGVVTFGGLRLSKGTYTLAISAFNESGESISLPLGVLVTPGKPRTPTGLRVVKVAVQ